MRMVSVALALCVTRRTNGNRRPAKAETMSLPQPDRNRPFQGKQYFIPILHPTIRKLNEH